MITLDLPQLLFHHLISSFGGIHSLTKHRGKYIWALQACLSTTPSNSMEQLIKMYICLLMVAVLKKTKLDIISQKLELFLAILIFSVIQFNISMIMSQLITIWRPAIQVNCLLQTILLTQMMRSIKCQAQRINLIVLSLM